MLVVWALNLLFIWIWLCSWIKPSGFSNSQPHYGLKFWKTKYFPHTNLFERVVSPRGSHIWKAIHLGMQWLKKGMRWIIGDGQTIRVWEDHWIPSDSLRSRIVDLLMPHEEKRLVSSLRDNHIWRLEGLQIPLLMQFKQLIKGILVAQLTKLSNSFI